ncbi:type II toxin-antitoxin system PemK/MazF family toxin [Mesorhizobium sp.]|uniref:type II toxin-antitoxin system PemK/MazF family toxin n=1 Tax=Mesorhizobium sp. TaxID=1871066 RepID=UPI0025CF6C7B|nr:type II toxin-antitoxin system PemK/MazF family toxin [Mesorhizobium sp.]
MVCDYSEGFVEPEMVKRRPALVLCPRIRARAGLCTVVALSTTPPEQTMPYHCEIELPFALPPPFDSKTVWIKGDMVNAVGFHRIDLFRLGKDAAGKRRYLMTPVGGEILLQARRCILHGLGLSMLTKELK